MAEQLPPNPYPSAPSAFPVRKPAQRCRECGGRFHGLRLFHERTCSKWAPQWEDPRIRAGIITGHISADDHSRREEW